MQIESIELILKLIVKRLDSQLLIDMIESKPALFRNTAATSIEEARAHDDSMTKIVLEVEDFILKAQGKR